MIQLSALYTIYVEESGNPLLGTSSGCVTRGPGGASSPVNRQFFDPRVYRIIQFDQRGCGRVQSTFASFRRKHDA